MSSQDPIFDKKGEMVGCHDNMAGTSIFVPNRCQGCHHKEFGGCPHFFSSDPAEKVESSEVLSGAFSGF